MSEKADTSRTKATASPRRSEMEDMPPQPTVLPRKRKADRADDREPSTQEAAPLVIHRADQTTSGGRSHLVPVPSYVVEHRRRGNPETFPNAPRRMSVDMHRPRRPNMPNPGGPRPVRARRSTMPSGPPRTMLQHAWHTALNSDPLVDSDEECPDEHIRLDYNRRMQVITRLRGRPPTPASEPGRTQTTDSARAQS